MVLLNCRTETKRSPVSTLALSTGIVILAMLSCLGFNCSYAQGLSVETFLKDASAIQAASDGALVDLGEQINGLQGEPDQVRDSVERLKASRESIESARQEIDALDAPEAAAVLKQDLLDLYAQGVALLDELVSAGNYQLGMDPTLSEYEQSAKAFSACMNGAGEKESILACLNTYQIAIATSIGKAKELNAPTLSKKSHERFIGSLEALQLGISDMIAAIASGDSGKITAASDRLSSVSGDDEALTRAMQADRETDISAYNAKVLKLGDLSRKTSQDQAELRKQFDTK